ncbi:hypothetical protein LWI28_015364 [Acer negundo]|uniref:Uncharacterized protein n=1 Tax=Acer negundo TaxID=4023 RepID=A0AAD5JEF1_ACENE|nr:hypothetical protein LWI28_015364 [Acer negundo]
MATIVCQSGLQSCLESQIAEPRTLRLRLSSPRVRPHLSEPLELTFKSCFLDSNTKPTLEEIKCRSDHHQEKPQDPGSWSFLETITNGCQLESNKSDKDQNTYVHPLSKRSLSALSDKSLELCTENLGSETGTDIIEDSIFSMSDSSSSSSSSSSSDSESGNFQTREQRKSRQLLKTKKASNNCRNFPPPLTTIRGLESLQVRTHREDGRLIIKAVKTPSTPSLFKAERSHGRLRLSFFKDFEEPEQQEQEQQEMVTDEPTLDDENESTTERQEEFENKEEEEEEEEEDDDDENGAYREKEDMDGNNLEIEGEIGIKNIQRTGRCKERVIIRYSGGKVLIAAVQRFEACYDPLVAEAVAILLGLRMAVDRSYCLMSWKAMLKGLWI